MTTWAEIKRLAADLQRAQLGVADKKLSERNCIEVVQKLTAGGLVDLVCTLDAKEYVTRSHLNTQIRDECTASNGRVSLTDVSSALNVDYQVVADQAEHIAKTDAGRFMLAVGQLISREYLSSVCSEINESLQESGRLSLSTVTKAYDLPTELLHAEIRTALGKTILGCVDPTDSNVLLTDAHLNSQRANITAALLALTRVTPLHRLVEELGLQANLVFAVYDTLAADGLLHGSITGGRTVERAIYVPAQYEQRVRRTLRSFYHAEQYCDTKLAAQLGLANMYTVDALADALAAGSAHGRPVLLAGTCLVSDELLGRLLAKAQCALDTAGWVDVEHVLHDTLCPGDDEHAAAAPPSVIDIGECATSLCARLGAQSKGKVHSVDEHWLCTDALCDELSESAVPALRRRVDDNADDIVAAVKEAVMHKHAPATAVDDDGGKKRGRGKQKNKSSAGSSKAPPSKSDSLLVFASNERALAAELSAVGGRAAQCPHEVLLHVAERLLPSLNAEYRRLAEAACVASSRSAVAKAGATADGDANAAASSDAALLESIRSLHNQIMQFDSGAWLFDNDASVSSSLRQTLLRTVCVDAANAALLYYTHGATADGQLQVPAKRRHELIAGVADPQASKAFDALYQCVLQGKKDTLDEWLAAWTAVANAPHICALNLKPPDRRSKQEFAGRYEKELCTQLAQCDEPANGLLLACLLHIVRTTGRCVHATGKLVPSLVAKLRSLAAADDDGAHAAGVDVESLHRLQALVVANIKSKRAAAGDDELMLAYQTVKAAALDGLL